MPPRKAVTVVFNYYTLVSDDLISSVPNSGQYTTTFKCNIKDARRLVRSVGLNEKSYTEKASRCLLATSSNISKKHRKGVHHTIMLNKHTYKPSLKDIMDKYYVTMRCSVGGIIQTKQTFSSVPRTRTQRRELDLKEDGCWVRSELCVREKPVCHLSRLHSLSFIKISC
jgi:hypothetical protein